MSANYPRELHDEFPYDACALTRLKLTDPHFCNLAERYHALDRSIHRIKAQVESVSDAYLARLKKLRLSLLDTIAVTLEESEQEMLSD